MDRLVAVVEALRDHCPWTAALTHADLAEYLVEEAYEAVAEIESRDAAAWADVPARRADGAYPALAAELGDVLFQVVLHAAVSRAPGAPAETAGFRVDDAADALTAKMIRRNPLVLTPEGGLRPAGELAAVTPEAVELAWERVKAQERAAAGLSPAAPAHDDGGTGPGLDVGDIPARLPALAAAAKVVDRAARQEPDPLAAHVPAPAAEAGSVRWRCGPTRPRSGRSCSRWCAGPGRRGSTPNGPCAPRWRGCVRGTGRPCARPADATPLRPGRSSDRAPATSQPGGTAVLSPARGRLEPEVPARLRPCPRRGHDFRLRLKETRPWP